ncbi:MAG: type IV pilus secretin PilQ, partial [Deltaproteobacteria bacterium]|nr:type IV pilus secretin PilQ [Deltaproteobacteria bacterium]
MRNSPSDNARRLAALSAAAALIMLAAGPLAAQTFAPPASPPPVSPAQAPGGPQAAPQGQPGTGVMLTDPLSGMNVNKTYTGSRISLDFQNADIHNILRLIGEVSGKNVVVSDSVSGKVTLKLRNVPWDQALDIVLASKNLGMVENGNVIRIDSMDSIRRATPDLSDPATRVPLAKKMFTPKYSSVASLASEMEKGKSIRGSVRVIGNDIYVEDDYVTMEAITEIFKRNDRVTKQILIEARIVEAGTSLMQELGVRWGAAYDHVAGNGSNWDSNRLTAMSHSGSLVANGDYDFGELYGAVDVTGGVGRLGFGFVNRAGTMMLNAELNASETLGETRTISAPRIMAANDQEVYIKQGTKIPYTSGGTTAGTTASTQFEDATMELRVTPHIEENGEIVTLDITLTKDSPVRGQDGSMEIENKEARTKLMVRNGETVVIGGIITDQQIVTNNQVPGVHSIPLLGWLFKDRAVNNSKSELLIFITA